MISNLLLCKPIYHNLQNPPRRTPPKSKDKRTNKENKTFAEILKETEMMESGSNVKYYS
jgi:hypothetical protein